MSEARKPWFDDRNHFQPAKLATIIATEHALLSTPIDESGRGVTLYRCYKGLYSPAESEIRNAIMYELGDAATPARIDQTIDLCRELSKIQETELNKYYENGYVFPRNGLVDVETGKLVPADENEKATIQLGVEYKHDAKSPLLENFLAEVVPSDALPFLQEWVGYTMTKSTVHQVALLLTGEGGTAKSTFCRLHTALLGERNVSHVSLQDLSENRFATAELNGKLLNCFADLDRQSVTNSATFKALTGGDRIRIEKKYGSAYYITPFARLQYSMNEIPKTPDKSSAWLRRLKIIPFTKRIQNPDPQMAEKLTTPEVLSAFFNWALVGLRRLQANGRFSESITINTAVEEYQARNDSIVEFLRERVVADAERNYPKQSLYDCYKQFCEDNKLGTDNQRGFNARLREVFPTVADSTPIWEGRRTKCWRGIRLKDDDDDQREADFEQKERLAIEKEAS